MKIHPLAIGAVAAVGGAAIMLASGANAGTTSSSEQLIINQRISQAAVRRSNTALNYMGVIRTSTLDNTYGLNKSNPKGVTPLTQVTGAGLGWQTPQIRDGQVTSSKVADGAVTTSKIAAGGVTQAKLSSKTYYVQLAGTVGGVTVQRQSGSVAASRVGAGNYLIQFPVDVSGCIYAPNVMSGAADWESSVIPAAGNGPVISVGVSKGGTPTDTTVSVMVYCPGS